MDRLKVLKINGLMAFIRKVGYHRKAKVLGPLCPPFIKIRSKAGFFVLRPPGVNCNSITTPEPLKSPIRSNFINA